MNYEIIELIRKLMDQGHSLGAIRDNFMIEWKWICYEVIDEGKNNE